MANNPKRLAEASQWEVMVAWDGSVISSGVPSRPESQHHDPAAGATMITEAVVTAVYFPDEEKRETHKHRVWLTADVRTIGPVCRSLRQVPVFQFGMGLHDEDLWIPRAGKLNTEGGTLVGEPQGQAQSATVKSVPPTSADTTDGDRVLVVFLNGDPRQPILLPFTKGHPHAESGLVSGGGRIKRIRHHGTTISWDASGNLTLDASQAAQEALGASGAEQVTGTATVTVKAADGAQLVLSQADQKVTITAGADLVATVGGDFLATVTGKAVLGAPLVELSTAPLEPVLKGTSYVTAETTLYGLLTTYMAAAATAWGEIATKGAPGPLGPAGPAQAGAAAWAAGLATWAGQALAAQSTKVTTG